MALRLPPSKIDLSDRDLAWHNRRSDDRSVQYEACRAEVDSGTLPTGAQNSHSPNLPVRPVHPLDQPSDQHPNHSGSITSLRPLSAARNYWDDVVESVGASRQVPPTSLHRIESQYADSSPDSTRSFNAASIDDEGSIGGNGLEVEEFIGSQDISHFSEAESALHVTRSRLSLPSDTPESPEQSLQQARTQGDEASSSPPTSSRQKPPFFRLGPRDHDGASDLGMEYLQISSSISDEVSDESIVPSFPYNRTVGSVQRTPSVYARSPLYIVEEIASSSPARGSHMRSDQEEPGFTALPRFPSEEPEVRPSTDESALEVEEPEARPRSAEGTLQVEGPLVRPRSAGSADSAESALQVEEDLLFAALFNDAAAESPTSPPDDWTQNPNFNWIHDLRPSCLSTLRDQICESTPLLPASASTVPHNGSHSTTDHQTNPFSDSHEVISPSNGSAIPYPTRTLRRTRVTNLSNELPPSDDWNDYSLVSDESRFIVPTPTPSRRTATTRNGTPPPLSFRIYNDALPAASQPQTPIGLPRNGIPRTAPATYPASRPIPVASPLEGTRRHQAMLQREEQENTTEDQERWRALQREERAREERERVRRARLAMEYRGVAAWRERWQMNGLIRNVGLREEMDRERREREEEDLDLDP